MCFNHLSSGDQGKARHAASATSAWGASIDPRRWRYRYAVITVYTCKNIKRVWYRYVFVTWRAIESIVPSSSRIQIRISTTFSSGIVAGRYGSGRGRHNTEIKGAVLWAGSRKHFPSGRLAPSNSSIKTCSSTAGSSRIGVCGYSSGKGRCTAEMQCAILRARREKQFTSGDNARSNRGTKPCSRTGGSRKTIADDHRSWQKGRKTEIHCAVLWARRGKFFTNGRIAPSNGRTKTRTSTGVSRIYQFVATAAREVGTILKISVLSCGRGAGNIPRTAASLPLTAK